MTDSQRKQSRVEWKSAMRKKLNAEKKFEVSEPIGVILKQTCDMLKDLISKELIISEGGGDVEHFTEQAELFVEQITDVLKRKVSFLYFHLYMRLQN